MNQFIFPSHLYLTFLTEKKQLLNKQELHKAKKLREHGLEYNQYIEVINNLSV
jgi:hypothetical protein